MGLRCGATAWPYRCRLAGVMYGKDPRPALLRLRVRLLGFGCWSGEDLSLRRWSTEQRHRVTVSFFFTSIRRRAEGRRMNREMDRTLLNVVPVGRHVHRKGTTAWKGYPALRSVVDEVRILVRVLGAALGTGSDECARCNARRVRYCGIRARLAAQRQINRVIRATPRRQEMRNSEVNGAKHRCRVDVNKSRDPHQR